MPETFDFACRKLAEGGVEILRRSSILVNPAVDCLPGTPDFCNAALTGMWEGSPKELLALTQKTEADAGRPANHGHNTSRTLDLDIILFGSECVNTEKLQIPHPRARQRTFVMIPLAEIAPELIFPDTGQSVSACMNALA